MTSSTGPACVKVGQGKHRDKIVFSAMATVVHCVPPCNDECSEEVEARVLFKMLPPSKCAAVVGSMS